MFTHNPSGTTFENRKQAVICMGTSRYRKALKNGDFQFPDKIILENK